MEKRIRVGAVSYLNTRPLVYQLTQIAPQADIIFDLPSRLADRLDEGQLDVALIPSIEYFQNPDYVIVSDACIGCRGPVLSVKLFFRCAPEEVKTLALDEGSRTSAALAGILLEQRYGILPRTQSLPLGNGLADSSADAVLLIGDRAIGADAGSFVEVWDLGDQWCRWSELPFVFAMWVARVDTDLWGVDTALSKARDTGVGHLGEIAATEAAAVGLDQSECLVYLRDNLHFYFGAGEREGLRAFHRHAAQLGMAPAKWELNLHDCQSAR